MCDNQLRCEKKVKKTAENLAVSTFCINTHTHTHTEPSIQNNAIFALRHNVLLLYPCLRIIPPAGVLCVFFLGLVSVKLQNILL